jgi:hypothetical protein
MAGINQAID